MRITQLSILGCCLLASLLLPTCYAQASAHLNFKVSGINGKARDNVLARLATLKKSAGTPLNEFKIQQLYAQSNKVIRKALEPYGYFKATITPILNHNGEDWILDATITPGPALKIKQLDITLSGEGKDKPLFKKLLATLPLKKNNVFESSQYEKAKETLLTRATNQGYLKAHFTETHAVVNLQQYQANIILHFDTGPLYLFGPVHFEQTTFAPTFLQRFIRFKTGDCYNPNKLLDLQQALSSSAYFEEVTVNPDVASAHKREVPIIVKLKPRKPQQYSFGLGYGTDTGARGSIGWDWRRITDTGHHFKALVQASQLQNSLEGTYFIPGENPATDQYSLGAAMRYDRAGNGFSRTHLITAGYIQAFNDWQQTLSLSFQREKFKVEPDPTLITHLLMPSISWLNVSTSEPGYVPSGHRLHINLRGSYRTPLSDSTFLQADIQGKSIYSFTPNSRAIFRGEWGYTAVRKFEDLPRSVRFFAGGSQSVRGYGYKDLGPGRYIMTGSAEYQHRLVGNWFAAAFYDAGNAMDHWNESLAKGRGVGLVWMSPIGPMELTAAQALNKSNQPWMLQFSMGPDL